MSSLSIAHSDADNGSIRTASKRVRWQSPTGIFRSVIALIACRCFAPGFDPTFELANLVSDRAPELQILRAVTFYAHRFERAMRQADERRCLSRRDERFDV